ncbi:hypothetical protein SK128_015100, partial [Halocaridina rubra]
MLSWYVTIIIVSEDFDFLVKFAEICRQTRLQSRDTKLLVITSLRDAKQIQNLLNQFWTYSMMSTLFLNLQQATNSSYRWGLYSHLPYTASGPQNVQIGVWSPKRGLMTKKWLQKSQNKFANFYQASVNVTVLPYLPAWREEKETLANGTVKTVYSGADYTLLMSIANALNFSFNIIPSASWKQVDGQVEEGVSMMATIYHIVLPERTTRYDFTYTYENAYLSFSTFKPSLKPQWQALYYPFTDEVWIVLLLVFPFFTLVLTVVIYTTNQLQLDVKVGGVRIGQELLGEFFGQDLMRHFYNI